MTLTVQEQINVASSVVDDFTFRHLQEYASVSVFADEREDFVLWVLTELANDDDAETTIRYGWPSMYRRFVYERNA